MRIKALVKKSKKKKNASKRRQVDIRHTKTESKSSLRINKNIAGIILLVVLTGIAYFPALKAGFIWDDQAATINPLFKGVEGLRILWLDPIRQPAETHYWPLTYTTFWIEQRLWGTRPFGFHLVNVLLHILNAILVWRLLRRLRMPFAYIAALLFALHPVHVESVAWIIERKDVLSGLFYLLAFLSFLRFERDGKLSVYVLALFLFVCAMLSKSVAISLPLAIGIAIWWRDGTIRKRDIVLLLPFVVVAAGIAAFDVHLNARHPLNIKRFDLSLIERLLLASRAIWFYTEKLALPVPLMIIYPQWEINAQKVGLYVFSIALIAVFVALWVYRGRISRGPLAAALFFCVTLGPMLGLMDFSYMYYSYVADRFQYLASIGLITLAAGFLYRLMAHSGSMRQIGYALIVVICGIFAVLTFQHCRVFHNSGTLFRHNAAHNPKAWLALNNLGDYACNRGDYATAKRLFEKSLGIWPGYHKSNNNMGTIYLRMGQYEKAIEYFDRALRERPRFPSSLSNKGMALARLGKHEEAIEYYNQALIERPGYYDALNNKGISLASLGRHEEALECYREAITFQPDFIDAYLNLARSYDVLNDYQNAASCLLQTLEKHPGNALLHFELANALYKMKKYDKAIEHYEIALRIQPDFERARINLRNAQRAQKQIERDR